MLYFAVFISRSPGNFVQSAPNILQGCTLAQLYDYLMGQLSTQNDIGKIAHERGMRVLTKLKFSHYTMHVMVERKHILCA